MKTRTAISWILLIVTFLMLIGLVSSVPQEPDCAALWEAHGEEVGAACFDEQHLKNKMENN